MKPHPPNGLGEPALSRCRVIIDVLDRGGPDDDLPRCSVGGIGVRWNFRPGIPEFSHGIQGFVCRWFHGPVPASDFLRDGRARLRSGRGLCDVPLLGRRSPDRRRAHGRRRLALLHRLPGSDLLGCGFAGCQFLARGFLGRGHRWCLRLWGGTRRYLGCRFLGRRYLGRRRLWRRYLGRCHLGRRVFGRRRSGRGVIGCGLLGRDLPGRRVPGCETLRYGHLRHEQLRLGSWRMENCGADGSGAVAACRPSVKGCSAAGSNGTSTVPGSAPRALPTAGRAGNSSDQSAASSAARRRSQQADRTRFWVISGLSTDRNKPVRQRRSRFRTQSGMRR